MRVFDGSGEDRILQHGAGDGTRWQVRHSLALHARLRSPEGQRGGQTASRELSGPAGSAVPRPGLSTSSPPGQHRAGRAGPRHPRPMCCGTAASRPRHRPLRRPGSHSHSTNRAGKSPLRSSNPTPLQPERAPAGRAPTWGRANTFHFPLLDPPELIPAAPGGACPHPSTPPVLGLVLHHLPACAMPGKPSLSRLWMPSRTGGQKGRAAGGMWHPGTQARPKQALLLPPPPESSRAVPLTPFPRKFPAPIHRDAALSHAPSAPFCVSRGVPRWGHVCSSWAGAGTRIRAVGQGKFSLNMQSS